MFLDPEPKQKKHSTSASPFFSAQTTVSSMERRTIKRKPLQQRSESQNNQQTPSRDLLRPTVRLVKPSTPPSAQTSSDSDDLEPAKENRVQHREDAQPRLPTPDFLHEASVSKPGLSASSQHQNVSDSHTSTNEAQKLELPSSIALLPKSSNHVVPKTAWHRRSGSSGNYSISSTLKGSESAFAHSGRSERLSAGTTLRGTPTPYEQEHAEVEEVARQGPTHALQTLQETSPERLTIRAVPPSVESPSSEQQLGSGPSESSLARPQTAPSTSESERGLDESHKTSRRSSARSVPASPPAREENEYTAPRHQQSQESIAPSEATQLQQPSSPNFVAYQSDSSRPRSRSHPLRYAPSVESIDSVLQYPSIARPQTGRSLAYSSSFASLRLDSSTDTLAPLQVPKKRLRHKPKSLSLGSQSNFNSRSASGSRMESEELDTLPYPRHHYSSHLSTIASESERSRSGSQQLSHFSLGSGVLTGDDSSSIPLSGMSGSWPRRRRGSAPVDSVASESSAQPPTSSEGEPGDMTLGIFREESAKPQPLFKPRSPSAPGEGRRYDGPLPPIPPIPRGRESEEQIDTISELQSPSLRPKRSGYSLRQRSNSTPSQSRSRAVSQVSHDESERWSRGSSIFPTWAKHFYGGKAALGSASKISLSAHNTPRPQQRQPHARNDSSWTERSMTSRLGTGYSNITSGSPTSSHFLPSIFRPRTRGRAQTEGTRRSSKFRRSKRSRPSGEEDGRPDSLAIFNDPLPQSRDSNGEVLQSGQPKYGELKDGPSPQHPPLPRKYSKQKHWDQMQFPRPMTKDRLSEFGMHEPHLHPSRRAANRLSTWRAPSFVESLDTLVRSRCNRQILLFALGFICPLLWMLAAVLPLPRKPITANELEKSMDRSEEDVQAAMMKHEAGDAEKRWREERQWLKAKWWRTLNRIMSVIGVLVIGAVVSYA